MNVSESVAVLIGILLVGALLAHFLLDQRHRKHAGPPAHRQLIGPIFRDDQRYWLGGLFYYNPDDPDLLVPKRFGIGQSLNFAHPRAKWFLFGMLLVLLVTSLLPVFVHH